MHIALYVTWMSEMTVRIGIHFRDHLLAGKFVNKQKINSQT